MHKYIVMGVQGCGKSTQAGLLSEAFDFVHISVGDIFRWHIQTHTRLAARIRRHVAQGALVPDEIVDEVIKDRLELHDWNFGFILDGFPRNRPQAEFFLESYPIDAVIHIRVPDEVGVERTLSRRLCKKCGLDYNLIHHRPAVADTCDVCQGALVTRLDDTPDAIRARISDFHTKTEPILDLFREKGLVVAVDGTGTIEEVNEEMCHNLGLRPREEA